MKKKNILIFRNFTIEPLLDEVEEKLYRKFLKPNFLISGYENSINELLNNKSNFYKFKPDLIILFFNIDAYLKNKEKKINTSTKIIYKEIVENILLIVSIINKNFTTDVGMCNFSQPLNKKNIKLKNSLNIFLNNLCKKKTNYHLLNIDENLPKINFDKNQNLKLWKHSMYPFNYNQGIEISNCIYKFISARSGKFHKLIILDADNTLWKGIIGEGDQNKIKIKKTGKEKDFYIFQTRLKRLKEKGIVLALCSKNNLNDIKSFFKTKQKKKMPLTIKDFSNLKVNWSPKSENIKAMLRELNISIENSIFIDDSEFEIAEVTNTLPNLDTLLVPKLTSELMSEFFKIGNFETFSSTDEDKSRTKLYQIEERRNRKKTKFKSPSEYIRSLKIKLTIKNDLKKNIQRLSQMTIKTNQFNTTTLRLNEKNIMSYIDNKSYLVLQCAASDKFGDYGIVGLSIIKIINTSKTAIVENSLFSCRALGRMIEEHFYQKLFVMLRKKKITTLNFIFMKSDKNQPAYEFFTKYNFNKKKIKNGYIVFNCNLKKINLIKEKNIIRYN